MNFYLYLNSNLNNECSISINSQINLSQVLNWLEYNNQCLVEEWFQRQVRTTSVDRDILKVSQGSRLVEKMMSTINSTMMNKI